MKLDQLLHHLTENNTLKKIHFDINNSITTYPNVIANGINNFVVAWIGPQLAKNVKLDINESPFLIMYGHD